MPRNLLNLKVAILDPDFYALRAINSYAAWDRRTRVVVVGQTAEALFDYLGRVIDVEYPDAVIVNPALFAAPSLMREAFTRLHRIAPMVALMCLAQAADPAWLSAALDVNVQAYLLRDEVGIHLVEAVIYTLEHGLTVSRGIPKLNHDPYDARLADAHILPKERAFPEMTERIRQALWLCVVEGMSAQLAADEMGVSTHTIRSYIKEGYRILKTHDDREFLDELSPEEQAFMRFTALEDEADTDEAR